MRVKIKLFGRYKKIIGKSKIEFILDKGNTIWHIIDKLVEKYPDLEKEKKFILVSRNNVYTNTEEKIKNGDEITLSPPIVGGG